MNKTLHKRYLELTGHNELNQEEQKPLIGGGKITSNVVKGKESDRSGYSEFERDEKEKVKPKRPASAAAPKPPPVHEPKIQKPNDFGSKIYPIEKEELQAIMFVVFDVKYTNNPQEVMRIFFENRHKCPIKLADLQVSKIV